LRLARRMLMPTIVSDDFETEEPTKPLDGTESESETKWREVMRRQAQRSKPC